MLFRSVDVSTELRNRYCLSDAEVEQLAHYALVIEKHYGRPMDIEWGKDGTDGQLYILQARPETVKSQAKGQAERQSQTATPGGEEIGPEKAGPRQRQGPAGPGPACPGQDRPQGPQGGTGKSKIVIIWQWFKSEQPTLKRGRARR